MKLKHFFFILVILVFVSALLFVGCGNKDEEDDDSTGDDDDDGGGNGGGDDDWGNYRDALPDEASMTLSLPGMDKKSGTKALDELATFYDATVDTAREVNGYILLLLGHIDEITSYPPTTVNGATMSWGPWTDPYTPPTPVEMMFEMTETATDTYDYYLKWRARESSDPWITVWEGHTVSTTSTARRGTGEFVIDYTTAQSLDPTINLSGSILVTYDTITDGRQIAIEYDDFYDEDWEGDNGPSEAIDADYSYVNHADNTGEFLFEWMDDLHRETVYDYPEMEHFWFYTRWISDGDGRTDVVVTEGDLDDVGTDYWGDPIVEVDASECWASDFLRDYYIETLYFESGYTEDTSEGNSADCIFDAQFPQV